MRGHRNTSTPSTPTTVRPEHLSLPPTISVPVDLDPLTSDGSAS